MKANIQSNLSFNQLLSVVKQLTLDQKIKLSKELEKEAIDSKLSMLLKSFKTNELDLKTIDEEVEAVRKSIYGKQKH